MHEPNCEICRLLPTEKFPVLESRYWIVNLSSAQGYLGRSYVTLRNHKSALALLTKNEWLDFSRVAARFESAVRAAFGAELFNWSCLMNNAYRVRPAYPHVHWHVRPRYMKVVSFGGVRFTDPEFGKHHNRHRRQRVGESVRAAIAAKIQSSLRRSL